MEKYNVNYFEELYECKKQLLNELLVIQKIIDALTYSQLGISSEHYSNKVLSLRQELKDMEVDLKEDKE